MRGRLVSANLKQRAHAGRTGYPEPKLTATPLLTSIAEALAQAGLEAILIGNAAAAIQGAPVTTVDFDFMFRSTPRNLQKLKQFALRLDAVILRPYYPAPPCYAPRTADELPSSAHPRRRLSPVTPFFYAFEAIQRRSFYRCRSISFADRGL
jgi:hypothetical protein